MSPHKMTDTIPSDSGTNTPVVLDLSSESDSRDIESPPVEADFCAGRQANEPVAIVGIGKQDHPSPSIAG